MHWVPALSRCVWGEVWVWVCWEENVLERGEMLQAEKVVAEEKLSAHPTKLHPALPRLLMASFTIP